MPKADRPDKETSIQTEKVEKSRWPEGLTFHLHIHRLDWIRWSDKSWKALLRLLIFKGLTAVQMERKVIVLVVKLALIFPSESGANNLKPLFQFSICKMEMKLPHYFKGEVLTGVLVIPHLLLLYTIIRSTESIHLLLHITAMLKLLLLFREVLRVRNWETQAWYLRDFSHTSYQTDDHTVTSTTQ